MVGLGRGADPSELCQAVDQLSALVRQTPLVCVSYRFRGQPRHLYAKYESMNMTDSVKDRMALHILRHPRQ